MENATTADAKNEAWKPFKTKADIAESTSNSSLHSLPEFSSSSIMNVSSVIVPPKVPPRQRRGSDSAPGSPKLSSPMKIRQMTLGGIGTKPGSPKVEALKNDPFNPPPLPATPPQPPPRGRFLKKGGQTQSCLDVLESTRRPKILKSISEDKMLPATSKDDMFLSQTQSKNDTSISSSTSKRKKSENFFILQPNSSSLMTNVITEDTMAVSNDLINQSQTTTHVQFQKEADSLKNINKELASNDKAIDTNKKFDMRQNNEKSTPSLSTQKHVNIENSSSDIKNNEVSKKLRNGIDIMHEKTNCQDAKRSSKETNIIDLVKEEEKLKENKCIETKLVQESNDIDRKNDNKELSMAVGKIIVHGDSGDISKYENTSVTKEPSILNKKEIDNQNINHDVKVIIETNNESKGGNQCADIITLQSKGSDITVNNKDQLNQTRSPSNHDLKKMGKNGVAQPTKKQGMFDVVGNFSAISDYLPSVSSVTESLTNASSNIDASKLSKVVKFDMTSKVN